MFMYIAVIAAVIVIAIPVVIVIYLLWLERGGWFDG